MLTLPGSVALSNLRQKFLNEINANFYPLVLNATEPQSFVQEIRQKTNLLARFSSAGRAGRVAGTRELVAQKNYIVAYQVKGEDVQIIRVHHVAQKYPN